MVFEKSIDFNIITPSSRSLPLKKSLQFLFAHRKLEFNFHKSFYPIYGFNSRALNENYFFLHPSLKKQRSNAFREKFLFSFCYVNDIFFCAVGVPEFEKRTISLISIPSPTVQVNKKKTVCLIRFDRNICIFQNTLSWVILFAIISVRLSILITR